VLRRIYGIKREEVVEGWGGLPTKKLRNLYASLNVSCIIRVSSSWRILWEGQVARIREM
jgi:hypothetical protein